MKTGLIYGYPNKPLKKRYSYHGVDRDCLIQPDPSPFDEIPFLPPGPFWILEIDIYFSCPWANCFHKFSMNANWLPSSDPDLCIKKWSPPTKRYYWVWLYITPKTSMCAASFSDGANCKYTPFEWLYVPTIFSLGNNVWADSTRIVQTFNAGPGSHIMIWRSETGELPPNPPI